MRSVVLSHVINRTDERCSWFSNVSDYHQLDPQVEQGPTFQYEYSARDVYGPYVDGWGEDDPLNATWWHRVTEGKSAFVPIAVLC